MRLYTPSCYFIVCIMADAEEIKLERKKRMIPFSENDMEREKRFPDDYESTMALVGGGVVGLMGIAIALVVYYKFKDRHI